MDTSIALHGAQGNRLILSEKPLVLPFGKPGPIRFPEGMHLGQDLVRYDAESPHVDFSVVAVCQLVFFVHVAAHLRRDVR